MCSIFFLLPSQGKDSCSLTKLTANKDEFADFKQKKKSISLQKKRNSELLEVLNINKQHICMFANLNNQFRF
jgi:hypothetical protein